jgi:hypothetical protein
MAWTYSGIRIYTQDIGDETKQTIARLQPLAGGTVQQLFGYESLIVKLTAKVVGNTNRDALKTLSQNGSANSLVAPEGSLGTFMLASFASKRDPQVYQFIDLTQNCLTPVYTCDLELYLST